jgi:hypothetical protein
MSVTTTTLCGLSGISGLSSSSSSITCSGGPIVASNSIPGGVSSGNLSIGGGGLGLGTVFEGLLEVLGVLILVAVVGIFVIIVVANRADPDPSGRRPQSVYYFAVSFITLATSIIGSAVVVIGLVRLVGHHSGSITNSTARTVVIGGLIALVSLFLLVTHLRRGLVLARAEDVLPSPSQRVGQSYVAAVAFVAMLTLLVTGVVIAYLVIALIGPGVFGAFGGRVASFRYLIVAAYLGLVALAVLQTHRNLLEPRLRLFPKSHYGGSSEAPPPPPVDPPTVPLA